ncbi:hypothetical protein [Alicyclobacillus fastidiosus]|uniref:Uncharacterized protein n=1 Tax=Alicyclobacillus fastidiosus TaxID=392011 RepID=A0ABV5AIQ7_9BACL|nr:hypothetical protein [Alicyclobacillus fastidiosus]WEH09161.1 hypothetical protein PYS47_21205 [Alicyclobacillus fastidiosus]
MATDNISLPIAPNHVEENACTVSVTDAHGRPLSAIQQITRSFNSKDVPPFTDLTTSFPNSVVQ